MRPKPTTSQQERKAAEAYDNARAAPAHTRRQRRVLSVSVPGPVPAKKTPVRFWTLLRLADPATARPQPEAGMIPSPDDALWQLGPLAIRPYALAIVAGLGVGIWWGERRWRARGGPPGTVAEVAIWAVPFGVVGSRLYHVLSSPDAYLGSEGDPSLIPQVWLGGHSIWGAIAFGGVGAWIGCRLRGVPLPPVADAVAPGLALGQAIGRLGNWFNQELYGRPTGLPWGLQIDLENRHAGYESTETFHPIFLYEALWNLGVAVFVVWADRRFRLGHGRAFALYVLAYTAGRSWIELLRIDPAVLVFGLRLNSWTSLLAFAGALTYLVGSSRLRPGREAPDQLAARHS